MGPKADDEVDDETDNDIDYKTDGQPDTTDMSNLETEESAEQEAKG